METPSLPLGGKEKWYKNPMIWIGVIVVLVIVWVVWPEGPGEYDTFANCLSESGAVMYGTNWCGHCKDQKELFGKSFDNVNYVDCDRQSETCLRAGVGSYPTWIIEGEIYTGAQELAKLAELTGCELVKDSE
jgi:hypothetical protein